MDAPLPSPRLARKASSLPPALTPPVLKTLGLEEDDPEDVFEIHSKEGAGAFGRVFKASYRTNPTRLAALKVIPVALEAGQRGEDIENVRREIQFLRECDHPNVVAFFGAYYKDHALWVAMEYCGGGSVGDVSRRRRLDERELAVITRGALQGLAYLHARKKIHRDIKGGNILLTSDGDVKIADFGVSAQLKDTLSRRGTFVGTPYWMSPEMIQDSDYDYKSDIWSLGITLIELADQKPPLFDEHPMRVLIQIPRNPPPTVQHPLAWTPLLPQFLAFCLRKDPTERPSALECLDHAFIAGVRDELCVYAEGYDARRRAESHTAGGSDVAVGSEAPEQGEASVASSRASTSVASRTLGSLTASTSDSEAMADDVTLRAPALRPLKAPVATPVVLPRALETADVASLRRPSVELERAIVAGEAKRHHDDAGAADSDHDHDVGTPRDSESAVDELWDLSQSAVRTSSRSSRSNDDSDDDDDASATGFAFRQSVPLAAASPVRPAAAPRDLPRPPTEMVSGDELLRLSVDDSFEMPAMALISKIHAAASTLAGHSIRPRPAAAAIPVPLPLPMPSAPSPVPSKVSRKGSIDDHRVASSSPANDSVSVAAAPARRELNSFSRTDSIGRASVTVVAPDHSGSGSDTWRNPLTELTTPSSTSAHDRVHSLLASLSASTSRLLLPPPSQQQQQQPLSLPVGASMEFSPHASLRSSRPSVPPPTSSSSSSSVEMSGSTHFIGTPFRVSHQLNVKYNTVDAKFEGVPSSAEWASVHKQFGIALAQLRSRSKANGDYAGVPALVQMLRRELVKRDGLECKYIYRVSPDQSEIQHAKTAINGGAFDAASVSDPHVFASLLKLWLRELPTPLLGAITRNELATYVQRLVKPDDVGETLSRSNDSGRDVVFAVPFADVHAFVTGTLLVKLPTAERSVLLWLVDHLLEVTAKSTRNAMTAQSLAVVFAPSVYRWASTTPADASLISKQVATLLRALLAWRQRGRGGNAGDTGTTVTRESASASISGGDPLSSSIRNLSVRSRLPAKADPFSSPTPTADGVSISLRDSLNSLRSSLTGMPTNSYNRDSTVSSILRRSSIPGSATTHFVAASSAYADETEPLKSNNPPQPPDTTRVASLETLLRDCVDGLWNELPLSIMLDDPPPITRSLFATFQRTVLTLVQEHGRREQEKRWATELLERLNTTSKANQLEKELIVPLSLRPYTRWILAAVKFDAFITLLKQERQARDRLEKPWPNHQTMAAIPLAMNAERAAERFFTMDHVLQLASMDRRSKLEVDPSADDSEIEHAMLDGAATYLHVLQQYHASRGDEATSVLPLAEELVKVGEQEPVLGNLLLALSGQYTHRYHLDRQHQEVIAMVEQLMENRQGRMGG